MPGPIVIICPNLRCRSVLSVPDRVRGKRVRCGHCGTHFTVPAKAGQPAAVPPNTGGEEKP